MLYTFKNFITKQISLFTFLVWHNNNTDLTHLLFESLLWIIFILFIILINIFQLFYTSSIFIYWAYISILENVKFINILNLFMLWCNYNIKSNILNVCDEAPMCLTAGDNLAANVLTWHKALKWEGYVKVNTCEERKPEHPGTTHI